jgi:AcrR family transcriptional regulator
MVSAVYESGFAGASVTGVCARAKVSRQTFYSSFATREECFLAVLDEGYRQTSALIRDAFADAGSWREGVRTALAGLLLFFDAHRELAWVWLVESLAVGVWALERRERNVAELTRAIVEHWSLPKDAEPHSLATVSVMAAVLGAIQSHVLGRRPEPLIVLLGPLMGVASAPYLDAEGVAAEIELGEKLCEDILVGRRHPPEHAERVATAVPDALADPRARRARQCLLYVVDHPGASNRQIADAVGVSSQTQISTLLARLRTMGLLCKVAGRPGHANAWSPSADGERVALALREG